jgi:hypothetical protein
MQYLVRPGSGQIKPIEHTRFASSLKFWPADGWQNTTDTAGNVETEFFLHYLYIKLYARLPTQTMNEGMKHSR